MKKQILGLTLGLALFGSVITASAESQTWFFYQGGWTGGGVITGAFVGNDLNLDGQLVGFASGPPGWTNEVSGFSVSLYGNSTIPNGYTWTNFYGLVYDINGDSLLGNDTNGAVEGFAVNDANGANPSYNYASGYGPTMGIGGQITTQPYPYMSGSATVIVSTPDPIMISTSPITEDIYQENINSVPEPATLALAGMGGLSLLLFRRRKS
jgi:opacity protein-like surface antigen